MAAAEGLDVTLQCTDTVRHRIFRGCKVCFFYTVHSDSYPTRPIQGSLDKGSDLLDPRPRLGRWAGSGSTAGSVAIGRRASARQSLAALPAKTPLAILEAGPGRFGADRLRSPAWSA
jgi:hypothetical protein